MSGAMTKEEFVRKTIGTQQTRRNNYIKSIGTNTDVDTFTFNNTKRIKNQKHIKW